MMNGLNSFDDAEVGRMFKMQRMQQAMQQEFGNMHGGNGPEVWNFTLVDVLAKLSATR